MNMDIILLLLKELKIIIGVVLFSFLILSSTGCQPDNHINAQRSTSVNITQTDLWSTPYFTNTIASNVKGITNPKEQLLVLENELDELGKTHIRLIQIHLGIPVWGAEVNIHINPEGEIYFISQTTIADIQLNNTTPNISKKNVKQSLEKKFPNSKIKNLGLHVFRNNTNDILVYVLEKTLGLSRSFLLIDGNNGKVISEFQGNYSEH
ncbi:MAG: Zn-dependent metalloprotease [Paraglaciecola sp.]|jgi:Zn-dependent metalloprotease